MQTAAMTTVPFKTAFADLLAELDLSQFQAAVLLGVSPTQISRWTNGRQAPHPLTQEAVLAKMRAELKKSARKPKPGA